MGSTPGLKISGPRTISDAYPGTCKIDIAQIAIKTGLSEIPFDPPQEMYVIHQPSAPLVFKNPVII